MMKRMVCVWSSLSLGNSVIMLGVKIQSQVKSNNNNKMLNTQYYFTIKN
jgi:hypothetical protein